jgi:heme/copper-type cytochrome/quinol oxidase subunit 2
VVVVVIVVTMVMVRLRKSRRRKEQNCGKQQGLLHARMIAITVMTGIPLLGYTEPTWS